MMGRAMPLVCPVGIQTTSNLALMILLCATSISQARKTINFRILGANFSETDLWFCIANIF